MSPAWAQMLLLGWADMASAAGPFGLALTPPMGWRSWNAFHRGISQAKMQQTMDKMTQRSREVVGTKVSLLDLGYSNCGLDDNWQACGTGVKGSFHDANGTPLVNLTTFPDMGAMVAHGHSLGLHIGWYINNCICGEQQFRNDHQMQDKIFRGTVRALVDYGFDGVKIDSCSEFHNMTRWAEIMQESGRPILTENCHNSDKQDPCSEAKAHPASGVCPYNFWRTSGDIGHKWDKVWKNLQTTIPWQDPVAPLSRPGRWAYPDMLEVGNLATFQEDRAHFGAWCIVSSPLILGYDLTDDAKTDRVWPIISNREAIAVNQAWAGHPGRMLREVAKDVQLWVKPLNHSTGEMAVLLLSNANPSAPGISISISLHWLGLSQVTVRDIWTHSNLGTVDRTFKTDTFRGHDSRFYTFTPVQSPMPPSLGPATLETIV